MEANIENLTQEQAYRAEYLQKEKAEVDQVNNDIKKDLIYIEEQKKKKEDKRKAFEKEIQLNKKLQREIEKLAKTKQLLESDIAQYNKDCKEHLHVLKTYDQQVNMAREKIEKLLESEPWIGAEEPYFG